jgi:hypothetical protein
MDEEKRGPIDEEVANALLAFKHMGEAPEDKHLEEARSRLGPLDELIALEQDRLALALLRRILDLESRLSDLEARVAEAETDAKATSGSVQGPR